MWWKGPLKSAVKYGIRTVANQQTADELGRIMKILHAFDNRLDELEAAVFGEPATPGDLDN